MNTEDEWKIFNTLKNEFNKRSDADPHFKNNVSKFNRNILFTVTDSKNSYLFRLQDGKALDIQQVLTSPGHTHITMQSSIKHLMGILCGQISPGAALMHPQIRIRGSPADLAFIKKFLLRESQEMRNLAQSLQF